MWHILEDPSQTTQPRRLAYHVVGQHVWVASQTGASYHRTPASRTQENSTTSQKQTFQSVIQAPMTGRIVQVDVTKGMHVAQSDVLLVLEAMKMEYRLVAPNPGQVESVTCGVGDLVHLNDTLITLRPS